MMYNLLILLMGLLAPYSQFIQTITLDPTDIWDITMIYRFPSHLVKVHHRHEVKEFSVHVIEQPLGSRTLYELDLYELPHFLSKFEPAIKKDLAA